MTIAMAAVLAYPITQSKSERDSREMKLERALKIAKAVDGQEDPPPALGDERLLAARLGEWR